MSTSSTSPEEQPAAPHRPIPEPALRPLDVDGTTTVAIGVALWGIAGLVLLVFFREQLVAEGRGWWLWTCLAGFGLGLLGWTYCRRRRDRALARGA